MDKKKLIFLLLLTIAMGGCTYSIEVFEDETFSHGCWSPDGKQIAFCRTHDVWRRATGLNAVPVGGGVKYLHESKFMYVYNMETKKLRKIADIEGASYVFPIDMRISWEGNEIAYCLISCDDNQGIFIVNTESGDKRLLVKDGTMPDISPDGTEVAYLKNVNEVWIINCDGTGNRFIKTLPHSQNLHLMWQEDGKNISVYSSLGVFELNIDSKEFKKTDLPNCGLCDMAELPVMRNFSNKEWGVPSFPRKVLFPF